MTHCRLIEEAFPLKSVAIADIPLAALPAQLLLHDVVELPWAVIDRLRPASSDNAVHALRYNPRNRAAPPAAPRHARTDTRSTTRSAMLYRFTQRVDRDAI
jgi:hypothetical protein